MNEATLIEQLENEFRGAYPEKSDRQGGVMTIDLVAQKSQWGIVPPYQTGVWSYNGQIPGPIIRMKLGETLEVNFLNRLPQQTTIHWHGVRVPNAMDGVPGVTQPPVKSGGGFRYRFTPKDAGTFWFHPHLNAAEQIERGLNGVLIVEDQNEPKYSQDLVMVLDDWLLEKGAKIHSKFVTRHDLAHDGRWGNVSTVNGAWQPSMKVKPGERIRLRLINVANGRVFMPQIQGLSATVIAVDGMLTGSPFSLENFPLAPGNRLDLDIVIPADVAGKSLAIVDVFPRNHNTLAFLSVESVEAVETPLFDPPRASHFPAWREAETTPVSHEFELDAKRGGPYGIAWTIDGVAWPENKPYEMESGRFQKLRIVNASARLHPMHLHGQFFKVIARNGKSAKENFWRDTVLIAPEETVDIGIVPQDKGLWAYHCHILEHAEAGMMGIVKVR
ncbi:MAG: multicopper oxidase family protein [Gammaproteobacteria bacterium]